RCRPVAGQGTEERRCVPAQAETEPDQGARTEQEREGRAQRSVGPAACGEQPEEKAPEPEGAAARRDRGRGTRCRCRPGQGDRLEKPCKRLRASTSARR